MSRKDRENRKQYRSSRMAAAGMMAIMMAGAVTGCGQAAGQVELTSQTEQTTALSQAEQTQAAQVQTGTQTQLLPGADGTLSPVMEFDRLWSGTYHGTTSTGLTAFYIEETGPELTPDSAKASIQTEYCVKVYLADLQTKEETSFLCGVDFDKINTIQYGHEGVMVNITRNEKDNTVTITHTGDLGVKFSPEGTYTLITR